MKNWFRIVLAFALNLTVGAAPLVVDLSGDRDGSPIIKIGQRLVTKQEFRKELKSLKAEQTSANWQGDWPFVRIIDKSGFKHLGEIALIIGESGLGQFEVTVPSTTGSRESGK